MKTILVLLGCLACALARTPPSFSRCIKRCDSGNARSTRKVECKRMCSRTRDLNLKTTTEKDLLLVKNTDATPQFVAREAVKEVLPAPPFAMKDTSSNIKECYDRCGSAYGSGPEFATCIIKCAIGGGKKLATTSWSRNMELPLDIMKPVIDDIDYKKLPELPVVPVTPTFTPEVFEKKPIEFYVKECYERCSTVYKTGPDFPTCLIGCNLGGGEKLQEKVQEFVKPFTANKEFLPEVKEVHPEVPEVRPHVPEVRPHVPEVHPEIKEVRPEVTEFHPDVPEVHPEFKEISPKFSEVHPEFKEPLQPLAPA